MNTIKNTLIFLASFIVVGLFVVLIDQLYPTPPIDQATFQSYSCSNGITCVNK